MFEGFKEIIDAGKSVVQSSPSLFLKFKKLYETNFGLAACTSCPGGFDSAWDLFTVKYNKHFKNQTPMKDPNAKFVLKEGRIIYSVKQHSDFGVANMTDDKAVQLLNESLQNIAHFEKFPEDWKELAANWKPSKAPMTVVKPAAPIVSDEADQKLYEELDNLLIDELHAKCVELNLPDTDWRDLSEEKLAEYLFTKITGRPVPKVDRSIPLDSLNFPQLRELCIENEYPRAEWESLKKKVDLFAYVKGKLTGEAGK